LPLDGLQKPPGTVDATTYILTTLALLALLALNFYLLGRPIIHLMALRGCTGPAERRLLTMATGMGLHMVLCAALGAFGQFNLAAVGAVFGVSLAANIAATLAARRAGVSLAAVKARGAAWLAACSQNTHQILIIACLSAPFLYAAIALASGMDGYDYHLPQARLIAEGGRLAVNEHLRHPLHPHYFHLLYATALLIWDDRLANVMHTASGILSALGVYYLGRVWVGRVVNGHARAVGVEDASHPDGQAMLPMVVEEQRFGAPLALVVAGAGTDWIDPAPIRLRLRVLLRLAVNLAGRRLEDRGRQPPRQPQHVDRPMHRRFRGLNRVALIVDRGGRTGEVEYGVRLNVEREGDVVAQRLEISAGDEVADVAAAARSIVVHAQHLAPVRQQAVAKVGADEPPPPVTIARLGTTRLSEHD